MRNIDVWYSRLDVEPGLDLLRPRVDGGRYRRVERNLAKAAAKDSIRALDKHGRRVVEGQRLMQAASDIFLGWVATKREGEERRCFYVRQLWDGKGSAEVERMTPGDLAIYDDLCGQALARAHARSGQRIAIASYLGSGEAFEKALARFAEAYADQNEKDYGWLVEAAADGEIKTQPS